jgi:hypothetical protein
MQNVNVVSRPKFPVLSNGAFGFSVSPILCTGRWKKLLSETVLAFNLDYEHIEKKVQKN